ncbi:hypothetical protein Afil01_50750 [Actinorhabdospora filicis]|uniref:Protein kinase domain-containing protein n=1 Tax=Actinorhabdospora filicis TaxID=1785913 RepID=A0A9W6SQ22_9ACTN|nr:hypothetical protein [Actinorhabdospora filicis]GLZ80268.1 hypothetical protein Afil01_50750 [Actinorhabdospora filicis]
MDGIQIIRWLSSDDTAAVYEAADAAGRPLVYTVGHRPAARPETFLDWAARLKSVRHAHLAPVADAGLTPDGRPYVLCGTGTTTLAEKLVTHPPGVDEVARTATALADALATAHAAGLRHGTVCPSTVLYTTDGTPQLTGFDMCAPELVKTARPGLYTAPEAEPGPGSDVYALAATAYVALGGPLPYASDPSSPDLRRRGITELPHVPPELIVTLRTALNPDPRTRPSISLLRDMLSTVEVRDRSATTALPMVVAGSDVRAANHGVVAVNKAVTGTLPRIGDENPPVPAAPPGTGFAPPRPRKRTGRKILAGVLVVAVLAAAGVAAWYLKDRFAGDDKAGAGGEAPSSIEDVDFTNHSFKIPYSQDEFELVGGFHEFTDPDAGRVRWQLGGPPVYADADGDGDTDAALILQRTLADRGGLVVPWIVVYTWDPATRETKASQSVAGICGVVAITPAPGSGFGVEVKSTNPYEGCQGVDAGILSPESFVIGVVDGWLTQTAPVPGSATRCRWIHDGRTITIEGAPKFGVHTGPDRTTAEVGEVTAFTAYTPDTKDPVEWVIASATLADGSATCGWVAAADLIEA